MRLISDLRHVNLGFDKTELYHAMVPTIYELVEEILKLKRKNPGLGVATCKRNIEEAFARVFINPDLIRLIATEFRSQDLGWRGDLICGHLFLPFGWVGSPAYFQMFANAPDARFRKFGSNHARWTSTMPSKVWTYVDDAMFVELRIKERMAECIRCWGWCCRRYFGEDSINLRKAEEEGKWPTGNILLGFAIGAKSEEIATPSGKIYGAKLLIDTDDFSAGGTLLNLKDVQTLRGLCQHWINASGFWKAVTQVLDALLGYADETAQAIKCGDAEIVEGWWNMVLFIMYLASRGDVWPCLFRNRMKKLLGLAKRLSGEATTESAIWTSDDATPSSIAGVNWANNQYLKLLPWDVLREFSNHQQGNNLIAECELANVIAIAMTWTGPQLTSKIVLNGSDNTNVLSWIRKRKANNRAA